mmetsp:Transcript_7459/g.13490  ORF Transcript_7459/g.13490 Transcript_7459/m.13490 type:complete len:394 (-) Transcript_7459:467-1648(-)
MENDNPQTTESESNTIQPRTYHLVDCFRLPFDSIVHDFINTSTSNTTSHSKLIENYTFSTDSSSGFPSNFVRNSKLAPLSFIEDIFCCTFFLFFLPSSPITYPILTVLLYFFNITKLLYTFILILFIFSIIPLHSHPLKPRIFNNWSWISSKFCDLYLRYFTFRILYETPLDSNKQYILIAPPHGVFPFGNLGCMLAAPFLRFPFILGLGASAAFSFPIMRQVLNWVGGIDASRKVAQKHLQCERTIGVSTGGTRELFEVRKGNQINCEILVLRNRRGIIQLALQNGVDIVPCYFFGNTQTLELCPDPCNLFKSISIRMRAACILFWGRFYVPIPNRTPLLCVFGAPIHVERIQNPSESDVDTLLNTLIDEINRIYLTHRDAYGWSTRNLVIT